MADPIQRLARQLERSSAQLLAIDTGRQLEPEALARERPGRFSWLPGRRREPRAMVDHETSASRERAEARHGDLPFDAQAEFDASLHRHHQRIAERETERALRRDRGIGREL